MSAVVCSVFPCCGKTYLYHSQERYNLKILDSDSATFHWTYGRDGVIVHPNWPNNYINYIKKSLDKYDIILVSSHKEIREALAAAGIDFLTIYPEKRCKAEWIGRAYLREMTSKGFSFACKAKTMADCFDDWVNSCAIEKNIYKMDSCEYLSNRYLLDYIMSFKEERNNDLD